LFYDSNNTGFYVDPASTSKLSVLQVSTINDAATNGSRGTIFMDGNFHIDAKGSYDIFANYYSGRRFRTFSGSQVESFRTDTDGIVYAYSQLRTPLIYDHNDTAYFLNPNATGGSGKIAGYLADKNDNKAQHWKHSQSNFVDGTLITTDINSSVTSGASFVMEVTGKSYSANAPFSFMVQGYLYNNTIISTSGVNNGDLRLTYVKVFNNNGTLGFWFPRISYWNSFNVYVREAGGTGDGRNCCTGISNSAEPTASNITKKVQINLIQSALYSTNTNAGNFYAQTYYDSNNTGYYANLDNNGVSIKYNKAIDNALGNILDQDGSNNYLKGGNGGSSTLYIQAANVIANTNVRGTIFYDYSNTGYYVDPNSGGFVLAGGTNNRVTFSTNDSGYKVSNAEGQGSFDLRLGAAWGRVGIYNSGVLNVMSDSTSGIEFIIDNTSYGTLNTDYLSHTSDIRSQLFYDTNDTGYYLNPNNASNLKTLTLDNGGANGTGAGLTVNGSGDIDLMSGGSVFFGSYSYSGGTYIRGYESASGFQFIVNGTMRSVIESTQLTHSSSIRSPIFYDTDNTAYYVDFASTGVSANLNGRIQVGTFSNSQNNSGEAWIGRASDRSQGCLSVQLGSGSGRKFEVVDSGWTTVEFEANDSGDATAHVSMRAQVFYDRTNTSYYIDPNSGGASIYVAGNAYLGRHLDALNAWDGSGNNRKALFLGWYSDKVILGNNDDGAHDTAYNYNDDVVFSTNPFYSYMDVTSRTAVRAPIYYDNNNTGYYSDNASTSRFNLIHSNDYKTEAGDGRGIGFWNGAGGSSYSIFMSSAGNGTYGGRVGGETTSDYNMYFRMGGGTNRGWVFTNGAANPVAGIDASGNFRAEGNVVAYSASDRKLKDNIKPIEHALDKVCALNGYTFIWNDQQTIHEVGKADVGVIAQEVIEQFPEVCKEKTTAEGDTHLGVDYERLVPALIGAIRELKDEIESLKEKLQ
jgi:hypothetical protein